MSSLDAEKLLHWGDLSADFFADVILEGTDHPVIRESNLQKGDDTLELRLGVAAVAKEGRTYGKGKPVLVYKLLLFDASRTLIKAVTNTGLAKLLENRHIPVGSTAIIKSYNILGMKSEAEDVSALNWKGVLLIKNFSWKYPPCFVASPSWKDPPFFQTTTRKLVADSDIPEKITIFHHDAMRVANKECRIVFTCETAEYFEEEDIAFVYSVAASPDQILKGYMIRSSSLRCDWKKMVERARAKALRADDSSDDGSRCSAVDHQFDTRCGCVKDFHLTDCVTVKFKVRNIDLDQLFEAAYDRLGGSVDASDFNGLSNSKKRWCLYWWYAVNIFSIRGGRKKLPSCVEAYVRSEYPKEHRQQYTGFKRSAAATLASVVEEPDNRKKKLLDDRQKIYDDYMGPTHEKAHDYYGGEESD